MLLGRAAVLALMLASGLAWAQDKDRVVNVYNWSDYIDQQVLEAFEKETGIKVVYDVFDSNDVLETKLLAGSTGYDVVVPSANFLARQIKAEVFRPLDPALLPNRKTMSPLIERMTAKYDPGNRHAVTYLWGTTGIGYDARKIKARMADAPVDSLRMLFDPAVVAKFADCGVSVIDAPEELFAAALRLQGGDPDAKDQAALERAEKALLAVRPYIGKFHSSQYINDLAGGDVCLVFGWSGDIFQARNRAREAKAPVEIEYRIPREGALMWFDMMAIPADAPNPLAAHRFIDFMLRPANIAKTSNFVLYANGSDAAFPLVDKAVREDPQVYPPPEVVAKLYGLTPHDARSQRFLTRAWTRIKGGS
ncbi:MAG: polyamine ABC transporter substrate-binding protein [Alphaproteobacteria bacterium]|nr:polyamine ABC transporter substrate-binding protein [Alphaproteobacteria bacterium]